MALSPEARAASPSLEHLAALRLFQDRFFLNFTPFHPSIPGSAPPACVVAPNPPQEPLLAKKSMLINATDPEEIRVATLMDGVLTDFEIEIVNNETIKGNIYKAKVVRVDQSLQAAFIHYGGQKNGFLPIGELPRDLVSPDGRRGRIQDLLNRDQEIMVQAVREEMGAKGAMMSAQVSLPGRYLVLTPGNPLNGISRKIESREEREYFKRLIDELEIPKNMGVIVRTASLGVTKDDFQRDLEYLLDTWKEVQSRYKHRHGAGLVWQEDDVVTRTLRDGFSADMEEVYIDDLDTYHAAQHFFKRTMPQHINVLKHYVGKKPIFSKYQTEEQIDRIYLRKVPLPSGGALVIDQTEALVAVDVNSGKTTGDNQEDTAHKTNMEAAEEVARQLRMRDLAGLVAIDFIDMKRESHIRQVQDRLVECLREDKARMEVGKINRFGVLVLTRQRIRPSISHATHEPCPMCQGSGKVKNLDTLVLSVVRRLKAILSRGGVAEMRVKLAPVIAMAVLNAKRQDLAELESSLEVKITILADPEMAYGEMAAEIERREDEPQEKPAAPKPEPRRGRPEDETVVLGGDSPISFDRALGDEARKVSVSAGVFKYDRRDVQRAALEERDRLRALFESVKPEDELEEEAATAETGPEKEKKGRRRRRGRGGDRAAAPTVQETASVSTAAPAAAPVPVPAPEPRPLPVVDTTLARKAPKAKPQLAAAPAPKAVPEPAPMPVVLDAASLLAPVMRPKRMAAAPAPVPVEPAAVEPKTPAKRGRKPKATEAPAPVAEVVAPAPVEPKTPAKRGRKPKVEAEAPAEAAAPKPRPKAKKA